MEKQRKIRARLARMADNHSPKKQKKWHIGETLHYYPRYEDDIKIIAENFLFCHNKLSKRLFNDNDQLLTIGSCFAAKMRES